MEEQREVEENHLGQQSPWLLNNKLFCYDKELLIINDNKKKQLFVQHNKNIKILKKLSQMGRRAKERR